MKLIQFVGRRELCEGVETGREEIWCEKEIQAEQDMREGDIEIDRLAWSETELSAMIDLAG